MAKQYITDGTAVFEIEDMRGNPQLISGGTPLFTLDEDGCIVQRDNLVEAPPSAGSTWAVKRGVTYVLGDIVYSTDLPSYLYLECTTAGTTSSSFLDLSGVEENDTITDGTLVWTVRRTGNTQPIVVSSTAPENPNAIWFKPI